MICNLSEAALHLGYRSRTTLQRLARDGHLEAYRVPGGSREVLLETDPPGQPSLRSAVQALTQIRYDSPLWRQERRRRPAAAPLAELSDEELGARCDAVMAGLDAVELGPDWALVAEHLNAFLGDSWPPPPYSGDQAATLQMCLSLAQEAAAGG
ncbi:MAG: hypothetical protein VKI63_09570 [Cyanobium sp.]|nr:hypothetical protein [Cyanobium sp.]